MAVPTYCQECGWFFDKMGACLPPGKLSIFSYISLLPYLIIFLFIGLTLWSRTSKQFRMLILLVSAYVVGDRLLKNLIQSPRPEGSCKKSFGMPSSHMTVITCYALELWLSTKKGQKIFLLVLVITQAISRV
jgi:membrane-associated phospholipid phosphatase